MSVYKDAEKTLLEDLKILSKERSKNRCAYIRLSLLHINSDEVISDIERVLHNLCLEKDHKIYVMSDGDIFIINRHLTQKACNQILEFLAPNLLPAPLPEGLATLYEFGVHDVRLRDICLRKIENAKLAASKIDKSEDESLEALKSPASSYISSDLIASIESRRHSNDTIDVMVVEDEAFSRELIGNVLNDEYSLCLTADGEGALLSYVQKIPSILFLDIDLPDMSGHEVLKRLIEIDPSAYVIMLSGNSDKDNILKAVDAGAKGFISKPFTKDKLIQHIHKSPFMNITSKEGELA